MAENKPAPLPATVTFATSGLGGIMGWIPIHPVNTLSIRMNLLTMSLPAGAKKPSFLSFVKNTVAEEGVMTLYKGIGAGIWRQIFYATSRYGLYEVFRDTAAKYRQVDFAQRFVTATVAGGCAAMISCPCEVSLVRMSNDAALPVEQRRNYKGVVDCASRIARNEGVAAFWRGCNPFVMRACLVGGTQVATYDQFKGFYKEQFGFTGVPNQFCSAFSAGFIYATITMPFESAKNRMAFQQPDPVTGKLPYTGTMQTIGAVAKADGVLALWNGYIPYFTRCGGHTVLMFIAVEQLRKAYSSTL